MPGAAAFTSYVLLLSTTMQTAMLTVTAARPVFSTDTSVFCGGQSGKHKQRISENAKCKIPPIICNDETILKLEKNLKLAWFLLKKKVTYV
jgi:hypothetical protein